MIFTSPVSRINLLSTGSRDDRQSIKELSITRLATVLFAGLLAGCQTTTPEEAQGAVGVAVDIGENMLGEPCRLIGVSPIAETPEISAAYSIFCGEWERPSARIYRAADTIRAETLLADSWWRTQLDSFTNCESPEATHVLGGVPAFAMDCALRVGGWPYQTLSLEIEGSAYAAESIPIAYPATERAIGIVGGVLTATEAKRKTTISQEIQRLEGRLAAAKYNINDLSDYRVLLQLGRKLNYQGNHYKAEKTYRKILQLHKEKLPDLKDGLSYLYMHIGLELSNQGRFKPADALFRRADELLRFSLEPTDEPALVSYKALHMANQRRNIEALGLAREATTMRRAIALDLGIEQLPPTGAAPPAFVSDSRWVSRPFEPSDLLTSRALTALGDVVQSEYIQAYMLVLLDKFDLAEKALDGAEQILLEHQRVPRRWAPLINMLRADIAEKQQDYKRAERLLVEAMVTQKELFEESRFEGLGHVALGRIYAAQGRNADALESFRLGFRILGDQGGGLGFDDVLPFFRVAKTEAGRNSAQRDQLFSEMFEVGQLVRGPVAAQSMTVTAARLASGNREVSSLIRNLQDARNLRETLEEQLSRAVDDPSSLAPLIEEMELRWTVLEEKVGELERQVQSAAPRYNQLLDTPVSTAQVFEVLYPGEAIVQILAGDQGAFGFFVDTNGIEVYEISLTDEEIGAIVGELRSAFVPQENSIPPYAADKAYDFYKQLLGPVAERLANSRHVISVPSGSLLSLPFGLLVTEKPPADLHNDYTQVDWLATRHPLSLAPSVQSFVNLRTTIKPSQATHQFVGFGDFIPSRDAKALLAALELPNTCLPEANLIANLPPLPETEQELREIASAVGAGPGDLHLGRNFTYQTLRNTQLNDYRIVYFATHGLLPHKLQCLAEPALAISPSIGSTASDDGLLTTGEVAVELELDADLVVLSACDTGGPEGETGGESLSGLARAFLYAGARSVLVTHWEIPSAPSVALLTRTFAELGDRKLTLSEALSTSQQALVQNPSTSHPFAWAAFTVVGDGGQFISR